MYPYENELSPAHVIMHNIFQLKRFIKKKKLTIYETRLACRIYKPVSNGIKYLQ